MPHKDVLTYPADGYKETGTIICMLDAFFPPDLTVSDFNSDEIKFQIIGFDDEFTRFIVDIAYWDSEKKCFVSYRDHLCKERNLQGKYDGQ